ncbi:uncharacterized protein UV8b_07824 [Ustilaginoidea virens]|uniref:Uncharacterized protein n=1 Tax=Ustilaginoidea virens TaxID=1159556 RepID=A0A8E5MKE8_USTVR|nr:uncharacterized protein UV8b_07824 [Ustilaginoidea virens]QUC23583.1 hypothetical protein UV8b_07824 [Ustilaginoidea virens]
MRPEYRGDLMSTPLAFYALFLACTQYIAVLLLRTLPSLDVQCSMLDIRCSMFDVQCSMFNVQCSMFDV